jgi:hypothetical protein
MDFLRSVLLSCIVSPEWRPGRDQRKQNFKSYKKVQCIDGPDVCIGLTDQITNSLQ